ncbi:hypothetical protein V1523DRAFT_457889 [Lipomyces doorenjongii]
MFVSLDGKPLKSCQRCRGNRGSQRAVFDLDECYETHEAFLKAVSSSQEQHDNHKMKLTLTSTLLIENILTNVLMNYLHDISAATCAQSRDQELHRRAAMILRNDVFDCTVYYFHLDGSTTDPTEEDSIGVERDRLNIRRYTAAKEFFECQGELHISFSKATESAIVMYEHKGHMEPPKFHMPALTSNRLPSSLKPYCRFFDMVEDPQFEKTELHTITRQQVYNIWISITRKEWERDAASDFRSAQLLVVEQDGYRLIEGLQEPGVSLAFIAPCFSGSDNRAKMTEVFIDSTLLYCVLTEYDLVSLPLKWERGYWPTKWFVALRNAGLNPNVVHIDKDFAGAKTLIIVISGC